MKLAYPFGSRLLLPAAFLSGATALVYEIVWARHLSLVLGSTTSAAAAVLSSFMLGLALGALFVGSRADRSRRPLRWYGVLEVGIGLYALALPSLLDLAGDVLTGSPWLSAFLLLLIPSALMGGTLPLLARCGADGRERGARVFGNLYGVNTIGAVAGAILGPLVLMQAFGLSGATWWAASVNIGLGILFWVLGVRSSKRETFEEHATESGRYWTGDAEPLILIAFLAAGFAGLALEMAWFRLLVYYLEGFTIAFGLMLAAYLLGLGAGALAGTGAAALSQNPRRLLARVLLAQGLLALLTFLFVAPIGDQLESMRAGYVEAAGVGGSYNMALFLASIAVIFPATFCAGMLTPVVGRIALSDREAIGRHCGAIYAATTIGAVLAPPVAGFWIIPAIGVPATIAVMAGLVLLAGTLVALPRGLRDWVIAGGCAAAFVMICLAADLTTPLVKRSHVFRASRTPRRLVAFEEGRLGGVSVVEELTNGARRLYIDGFSAAETGRHYGYMRMLGHLPVLLCDSPKNACVVAFGTGTTAGAVAAHKSVERLVCVEIEPAVFSMAPHFAAENRSVLTKKKTQQVVADGREYLRRGENSFDVITLEPLMPYTPAAVYLYTKEFYLDARQSLTKGGVLCQWIPPHGVSNDDMKRLIASVAAAFRHTSVWYFHHAVAVIGTDVAPQLDPAKLVERTSSLEIISDLRRALVGNAAHLLGAHVCSADALKRALDGARPFTDDHTELEYRPLPRGLGRQSAIYSADNMAWLAASHEAQPEWILRGLSADDRRVINSGRAALEAIAADWKRRVAGKRPLPADRLVAVVRKDPMAMLARFALQRRQYTRLLGQGQFEAAAQLDLVPDRSHAYLGLARRAADTGEPGERHYYLTLALRQNALLNPRAADESARMLQELARGLKGPQLRFVLNRAAALEGKEFSAGEEERPNVEIPDVAAELERGDVTAARLALQRARDAGLNQQVTRQLAKWFKKSADQRQALAQLESIGSTYTLRAALKLAAKGLPENLVAVAPIFARNVAIARWQRLCEHAASKVREAAADAAKGTRNRRFLPALAELCNDPDRGVRLSAFISFCDIEPAGKATQYDYNAPQKPALDRLRKLAEN